MLQRALWVRQGTVAAALEFTVESTLTLA